MEEQKLGLRYTLRYGYNLHGEYVVLLFEETWWGVFNAIGERIYGRWWQPWGRVVNYLLWTVLETADRLGYKDILGAFPVMTSVQQLYPDLSHLDDMLN